jgi:lipopolysaccharide export system protein LptA
MAKISAIKVLCTIIILFLPFLKSPAQSQNQGKKKRVEILHSDVMASENSFKRLIGNVRLKHNEMYMTCDSAHYFESADLVNAYSRVHIFKGDSLHLYGDKLIYDSAREEAEVIDSVILIDNNSTLYTDHLFYEMTPEIAFYSTGGRILNEDNVLTSIIGRYYSKSEVFHFKDSVVLVNPEYTMYADTLEYDTKTEIAYFLSPSEVIGDSLYVRCNEGWYDTRNEKSLLLFNAMVDNKKQIVTGDSLYYENDNGYGTAFYDVTISDLTQDIVVKGNKAWYYRDPERFMMTDSAQFIQTREDDYLYLHADTLWSVTRTYDYEGGDRDVSEDIETIILDEQIYPDSLSRDIKKDSVVSYRLLRAFYGARIYSDDLQAKCDSLAYSFKDSVIRLYNNPVIWSDENQLTSDSIKLYTLNSEMERLEMYNNAFVIEEVDTSRYQQIKGKNLTGYFRDNSIYKIEVKGNGENIYFALEENELVGVNQSTSASMDIFLEDGKIERIIFLKNPDGSLDPPLHKAPSSRKLDDFAWLKYLRPKDRWDIFREGTKEDYKLKKDIKESMGREDFSIRPH